MNNLKKPLISTLIFGLLAGTPCMPMANGPMAKLERDQSLLERDKSFLTIQGISRPQAFILGCLPPQKSFAYVFNMASLALSLRNASKVAHLRHTIYGQNAKIAYSKEYLQNFVWYSLGFLMRYYVSRASYSKVDSLFKRLSLWGIESFSLGILLGAGLITQGLFELFRYDTINKHGECVMHDIVRDQTLQIIHDNVQAPKSFKVGTSEIDALKALIFELGKQPHTISPHPLETALTRRIENLFNFLMEEVYTEPEYLLNSAHFVIALQGHHRFSLFDTFLRCVPIPLEHNPEKYTLPYLTTFVDTITSFKDPVYKTRLPDDEITPLEYPTAEQLQRLEYFFAGVQHTGYNPAYVNTRETDSFFNYATTILEPNPINTLLKACNGTYVKHNHFMHDVVKYFVETGMNIYGRKNYVNQTLSLNVPHTTQNLSYDNTEHNPIMRSYLKMVGRYNKILLDDKENLEIFIKNLNSDQQDDIFRIAATRGHMYALNILCAIDPEEYSLEQAADLALSRRCEKTFIKYLSLSPALCAHFEEILEQKENQQETDLTSDQKFFKRIRTRMDEVPKALDELWNTTPLDDEQKVALYTCMHNTMTRAHPTKFAAMIKVLRQQK